MVDHSAPSSGLPPVVAALWRRRWLSLAVFAGALSILASAVAAVPALYQATSTILVDRQQVPDTFVRSAVVGEIETRLHSLNQQILSRARLEELIHQYDLYPDLRQRPPAEAAVEQMRRDTRFEVKAVEQPGSRAATIAFAVSYRGWNPGVVAEVTNALASLYVEENSRGRERQAAGTAAFLKAQLDDMQQKVEEEERRMGQRPARLEADIVALEGLTTRLRLNSDRQVRAMDQRERLLRDPGAAAASAAPDALGAKLAALKQELLVLRTRFTEKYPDVIRVQADIAALERRLAETLAPERTASPDRAGARDPLAETNGELKALQDEERSLRASLAALERRIESGPQREQEFQQRARKYAMTKEVYDSLLKRYEDAQMAESMEQGRKGEHFTVLDPAIPPKVPLGPNRALLLLVSLGLAAGVAVGSVILAERLDSSFHTAEEIAGFTRVPVMASISHLDTEGDAARRRRRGGLLAAGAVAGLVLVAGGTYMIAQDNETLARVLARAH
jgi:polysaccharide chain length determinant protein (PEP-CTERM system associated)